MRGKQRKEGSRIGMRKRGDGKNRWKEWRRKAQKGGIEGGEGEGLERSMGETEREEKRENSRKKVKGKGERGRSQ
jgi:hypothetical protein